MFFFDIDPVVELGPELITNGGFVGNTNGWEMGGADWSYDTNKISHIAVGTPTLVGQLLFGLDPLKRYRVSLTITGLSGFVGVYLGDPQGQENFFLANSGTVYFDQFYFPDGLVINPSADFNGSITNVSVKEIL